MQTKLPSALLHELTEQGLAGLYVIQDGHFTYINQHFADVFGYDAPEEIINSIPVIDLVHIDDRPLVTNNIQLKTQGIVNQIRYQFRGIRADGSLAHVEVNSRKSTYAEKPAIVGILIDHTDRILAEERLKREESKVSTLLSANLIGIIRWDESGYIRYANDAFKEMIGLTQDTIDAGLQWHTITPGEYFYSCLDHIKQIISTGKGSALQKEFFHTNGRRIPVLVNGARLDNEHGVEGVSFVLNLSSMQSVENELASQKSKFNYLSNSNLIGIIHASTTGEVVDCNDKYLDMIGYTREEFDNGPFDYFDIATPESRPIIEEAIKELTNTGTSTPREKQYIHKDGHLIDVVFGSALATNKPGLAIVYIIDVSQQKRLEQITNKQSQMLHEAAFQATHDPLTKLQNRCILHVRLNQLIAEAKRENTRFTVGYMDLDNFKEINERHSHCAGDNILKAFAKVLQQSLHNVDSLARVGGDDFVTLTKKCYSEEELSLIQERIEIALRKEDVGINTPINYSIGWAVYPDDGNDMSTLLNTADQRMYRNKRAKKH